MGNLATLPNPQQPRSIYDDIADEQVRQTNQQVTQAVAVNVGNNPDAVGQAQRLGAQTGVGPDVALHNADDVQRQQAVQDVQARDLASWNPMLARQMSDPNFAAIAHDSIDNLSDTGTLFSRVKDALAPPVDQIHSEVDDLRGAYSQGHAQFELGMLGSKQRRGMATPEDYARINELTPQVQNAPATKTATGSVFGGLAGMAGNMLPMIPTALVGAAAGAGVGAIGGAIAGAPAAGVGAIPGAIAGGAGGFSTGFDTSLAAQTYEMTAGNAYLDMLNRGVDEDRAQHAAGVVGLVNSALQMGALRLAGKPLSKVTGPIFNRVLGDSVADAMTQPTMAKALRSALGQWFTHTGIASSEMAAQDIVTKVGNDYADKKGLTDTAHDIFNEDFAKQLAQSFGQAALTMGSLNAMTGMMGFSSDMGRVRSAERDASFFDALSQQAKDAKVRDRNPDSYQGFVGGQAQGTGAENIYIDGRQMGELLNQSGMDPAKVEAALPGLRQQVSDAAATGGDVTIPTEQYAARLAGTDLGEAMKAHMRLDPDAMSPAEAVEFQGRQKEIFDQTRQEAQQQMGANDEFAKSAGVVEQNIFDQLKATRTMPDEQARTNAQWVRDFVVTQAARQGETPESFFEKYRYTIQRAAGGDLLHQSEIGDVQSKPLHEMSPDELDAAQAEARGRDKNDLQELFGEEGARRYGVLRRASENPMDHARADAAFTEIQKMEEGLSQEQQNKLYGIGDERPQLDEIRVYREALGRIDGSTPGELADSLKYAVGRVDDPNIDPAQMKPEQRLAYAQLRHGFEIATENGWDTGEVIRDAIRSSAKQFADPDDAMLMLEKVARSVATSSEGKAKGLGEGLLHQSEMSPQEAAQARRAERSASLENSRRGGFDPSTLTTVLGQKSDMSSFLHETAHYFLSVYGDLAKHEDGSPEVKEDFAKLLKWFGVKDAATWDAMSLEEQRKYHEQFAYSYERYLAEGKAPSVEAQGIFDRFTEWLKRVYKSVRDDTNAIYRREHGEDLPILSGEVKDVMDRMLASGDQVKEAEAARNMAPLFKTQEAAGMDDAQWKAYRGMAQTATDAAAGELTGANVREMQWMSTAKGRLLSAMQAQHESARAEVREGVEKELTSTEPVYKAQRFLRTGEFEGEEAVAEHKMDTEAARRLLPKGAEMKGLEGMTKRGGMSPDEVAAATGFRDGKEMIESIFSSPKLKDAVDAETDQRMLQQHGEVSTPMGMAAAVEKAIHNEARARLIAFEMRHAFNMEEPERVLVSGAKGAATGIVDRQPIGKLNPQASAAREARAARQAVAAAERGDAEAVGRAKRDQLLQHFLTSQGLKAKDEVASHLKYLSKFDNPSKAVSKAIGADHMDAINELLAGYGISPRERYSNRSQSMADWINDEYARTGVMPAVEDELVDRLGTMHWRDMSISQLRDLRSAVRSIDYTGHEAQRVHLGEVVKTVDEFIADVQDRLADMKHTPVEDMRARMKHAKGLDKISAKFLDFKYKLRSADAALLKMEQLFQWMDARKKAGLEEAPIDGPMQSLYRLASGAEAKERDMRASSHAALAELGKGLRDADVKLSDALDIPELPRDGSTRWYREELLSAALNMGNDGNKDKLLRGYGWDEMSMVNAMNRLLSKPEMDFVQGVWDHVDTYWDGTRDLQRRQTGVTPQAVEATPFKTQHGVFKGGYYPVVYNDVLDDRVAAHQAKAADQLFENNYAKPATASGHTVARSGYVGPVYLSLGVIARHIDQVTHDLAWREAIVNIHKVTSDPRLLNEVKQVYGPEYAKQLLPWVQAMANDRVFNTAGDSAWEGLVKKARSNFTMVGIGFRLSTMAIHGTSALSNSLGELGPKWFAKGSAQLMGVDRFQDAKKFIFDRSPEMAHRMDEADRNIHEVIDGINSQQKALTGTTAARKLYDGTRKYAMRGVAMLDMASALPTWMGAYLKGMEHEAKGGMGLGEEQAIAYADRAVRNAHGGGGTKDLSAVQRDKGLMSLATMFYGYWNHVYNRQRDLGKGWSQAVTGQASVRDFPKLLARSWFYIVVPQIAHALLKPSGKKDEDSGTLAGFLKESAEGVGLGFVSGVPILRDIAGAAVHGRDYAFTPLESAGNALVHSFRDVKTVAQGETPKRGVQDTAESLGYLTGLPTAQPAASAKFLWDVIDGDVKPETVEDWWKGVLTGKIR